MTAVMEDSKKRIRVDSDRSGPDSPPPKLQRVDSAHDSPESGLVRVDSDAVASPEANLIGENLLHLFEDDTVNEHDAAVLELDSVIRSFEEEILPPELNAGDPTADVTSDHGNVAADMTSSGVDTAEMTSSSGLVAADVTSCPDANAVEVTSGRELGYLLEASDDELGLPPMSSPPLDEEERSVAGSVGLEAIGSAAVGFGEMFGFEDHYDSFESGVGCDSEDSGGGGWDYVALDGLFDHTDSNVELTWQHRESLSAL